MYLGSKIRINTRTLDTAIQIQDTYILILQIQDAVKVSRLCVENILSKHKTLFSLYWKSASDNIDVFILTTNHSDTFHELIRTYRQRQWTKTGALRFSNARSALLPSGLEPE